MDAVGADQRIALDLGTVREIERDAVTLLAAARGAAAEMDRIGLLRPHRVGEHLQKVRAVDRDIGKAVALDRLGAEVEQLPGLAGVPQPDFLARRVAGEALHRFEHAERMKGAIAVGADLDAGADLLEVGRLLVDVDVMAALEQRQCRGEPADAATGDQDVVLRPPPLIGPRHAARATPSPASPASARRARRPRRARS